MRRSLPILAVAVAAAALAPACAPMDGMDHRADAGPQCFMSRDVDNFRVESGQQLFIHSRRGAAFQLDSSPNCFSASLDRISVEPHVSAGQNMCPGDRVRVVLETAFQTPKTCVATVSGPITDSAVSGLPG